MIEKDKLDTLPAPIVTQLGQAELALTIDLVPSTKLGREDPAKVLANIEHQGYHIQMPYSIEELLDGISNATRL